MYEIKFKKEKFNRHLPSIGCFKPFIQIMKQHIELTFSKLLSRPVDAPADAFFCHRRVDTFGVLIEGSDGGGASPFCPFKHFPPGFWRF